MKSEKNIFTDFLFRSESLSTRSAKVDSNIDLRRKAWLTVFAVSALFWVILALIIWLMLS